MCWRRLNGCAGKRLKAGIVAVALGDIRNS